jgi:hypothetical protein
MQLHGKRLRAALLHWTIVAELRHVSLTSVSSPHITRFTCTPVAGGL